MERTLRYTLESQAQHAHAALNTNIIHKTQQRHRQEHLMHAHIPRLSNCK